MSDSVSVLNTIHKQQPPRKSPKHPEHYEFIVAIDRQPSPRWLQSFTVDNNEIIVRFERLGGGIGDVAIFTSLPKDAQATLDKLREKAKKTNEALAAAEVEKARAIAEMQRAKEQADRDAAEAMLGLK